MALIDLRLPYFASAAAVVVLTLLVLRFREPVRRRSEAGEWARMGTLPSAFRKPVLLWLFALSAFMYGFSHLPFVFGQPFIASSLAEVGLRDETPLVSGVVSAVMMLMSFAAFLMRLRSP